ncbi:MAG: acetylxylan esterase [Planctomycetia bacterium]|nr:acetylxylan esterase [Planctomycetia bacterium]
MLRLSIFSLLLLGAISATNSFTPAVLNAAEEAEMPINYDEASIPPYELPDPLKMNDGSAVKTAADWESTRRAEILEMFQREMFGRLPEELQKAGNHPDFVKFRVMEECDNALDGKAIRKQVEITFQAIGDAEKSVKANLLIYIPKNVEAPVPVFTGYNFQGNHTIIDDPAIFISHLRDGSRPEDESNLSGKGARGGQANRWDVMQILDAGYALATIHYMDVAFDDSRCMKSGIFTLYGNNDDSETRDGDDWGSITAWAWGLSRVMDYIETDPMLDAKKVAVMGHSRLGKTSLWTGATDPRFAVVISNNSGCGGAALSRRHYGESVQRINRVFPFWFCKNFRQYGTNTAGLPMDEHELIALMAPRGVYVASAVEDRWADPYGEYLSCFHAVPVYKLYTETPFDGQAEPHHPDLHQPVGNRIGYHIRAGKHDVTSYDWEQYIKFAKRIFGK